MSYKEFEIFFEIVFLAVVITIKIFLYFGSNILYRFNRLPILDTLIIPKFGFYHLSHFGVSLKTPNLGIKIDYQKRSL